MVQGTVQGMYHREHISFYKWNLNTRLRICHYDGALRWEELQLVLLFQRTTVSSVKRD